MKLKFSPDLLYLVSKVNAQNKAAELLQCAVESNRMSDDERHQIEYESTKDK